MRAVWAAAVAGIAVACCGVVDATVIPGRQRMTLPLPPKSAQKQSRRCHIGVDDQGAANHSSSRLRRDNRASDHSRRTDTLNGNIHSSRHTLGLLGGLTIEWAGGDHPEMLIVCGVSKDVLDTSGLLNNLYTSSDDGDNFVLAPTITGRIEEALFSNGIGSTGDYMAYAIPGVEARQSGGSSTLWVSLNSGKDWTGLTVPNGTAFVRVLPHPSVWDMFLATDDRHNVYVCSDVARAVTDNRAMACTYLDGSVINFAWSEQGATANLVYLTIAPNMMNPTSLNFVRWAWPGGAGSERTEVMQNVANFEEQRQYVFLTAVPGADRSESALYVSSDLGVSFQVADFPFQGSDNHFSIIDASEDFVLVAVDHNKTRPQGSTVVNIYPSSSGSAVTYNVSAYRALFTEMIPSTGTNRAGIVYDTQNPRGCPGVSTGMGNAIAGNYLLVERGTCKFYLKAQVAEALGAVGVIIINTADTHRLYMQAPDGVDLPNISAVIVSSSDGARIKNTLTSDNSVQASFQEIDFAETVLFRQSNLYASDVTGTRYSISLKNVLYESAADFGTASNAYTDVYKVESMSGTYIANYRRSSDNKELTVITYDKGAYWWTLDPPSSRQCSTGLNNCKLRLVLESSNVLTGYPMPQSTTSAMGIIVANGWIQDGGSEEAFTVISRDGGVSWNALTHDGTQFAAAHNYRILDHGAVIVFSPHRATTTTIDYSLDEGQSGNAYSFAFEQGSADPVVIQGVVTEPGGTTTRAFGYYVLNNNWEGVKLDFQNTLGSPCAGDNDFEAWKMTTQAVAPQCILGQTTVYMRRKPCTLCWNQQGAEIRTDTTRECDCSNQDFRCTESLHRPNNIDAAGAIACELDPDANLPVCGHDSGVLMYTLISDDRCSNADQSGYLSQRTTKCRPGESLGQEIGKAIGYLVAASLIAVLLLGFLFTFSKEARDTAIAVFGTDGAIGSFLLKFNCFRRTEATYIYSKLNDHTDPLFEEDEDEDANELGLYDDEDDEDDDNDDDDMLFSMADEPAGANRGLPIADY